MGKTGRSAAITFTVSIAILPVMSGEPLAWSLKPVAGTISFLNVDDYCGEANCYDLLNVSHDVQRPDLINAWRQAALRTNATPDHVWTEKRLLFWQLWEANEVLSDPKRRANYDIWLRREKKDIWLRRNAEKPQRDAKAWRRQEEGAITVASVLACMYFAMFRSGWRSTRSVQDEQDDPSTKEQDETTFVSEIVVDRSAPDATLGLRLEALRSDVTLEIKLIETGLVSAWNADHPGNEVREGDHIFQVNDVCGLSSGDAVKLMEEVKQHKLLRIRMQRRRWSICV